MSVGVSMFVHTFVSVHAHTPIRIRTYAYVYGMLMFMCVSLFALGVSRNCMTLYNLWVLQFYMFNYNTNLICEVLVL